MSVEKPTGETAQSTSPQAVRLLRVQAIIEERGQRETLFGAGLFSDPAWDILLHLYCARLEQERVHLNEVGRRAGLATTSLLRWIERLESAQLVRRLQQGDYQRRVFVELTDPAIKTMEMFIDSRSFSSRRPVL